MIMTLYILEYHIRRVWKNPRFKQSNNNYMKLVREYIIWKIYLDYQIRIWLQPLGACCLFFIPVYWWLPSLSSVQAQLDANHIPCTWFDKVQYLHYLKQPVLKVVEVVTEVFLETINNLLGILTTLSYSSARFVH